MNDQLTQLENWGAIIQEGISRVMGDDAFYHKLVFRFVKSRQWDILEEILDQKRYEDAFLKAHDLRGVTATLALKPLYEAACAMVEDLRGKTAETISQEQLKKDWIRFQEIAEELYIIVNSWQAG